MTREPKPGDTFLAIGIGEEDEDETLTVQEVVENEDLVDGIFEVVAEEDGESYEIHDDGVGNWVSD